METLSVVFSVAALEVLLSGDNALVLAVLVRPLPPTLRPKALFYGLVGAYLLRALALLLALALTRLWWAELLGGIYLLQLSLRHLLDAGRTSKVPRVQSTNFWRIVLLLNLVDLAFAVDSVLAVLAFSRDLGLVFFGVGLGILLIRVAAGVIVGLMERLPALERVAYLLVGWAGVKLLLEGLEEAGMRGLPELPRALFLGVTLTLLVGGGLYAYLRRGAENSLS